VKMRPLPDIDLARLAPLSIERKRKSLQSFYTSRPSLTYNPLRSCYSELLNLQHPLLGMSNPTDWSIIERKISASSKSDKEKDANIRVSKGLHDFTISRNGRAQTHDFSPISMAMSVKVCLWLQMITIVNEMPYAIFIDPRQKNGLDADGRKFVFSMMHERFRVSDADYASIGLAIIRFDRTCNNGNCVQFFTDEGIELYSPHEMELMVSDTYTIWNEICLGRDDNNRRRATGNGSLI